MPSNNARELFVAFLDSTPLDSDERETIGIGWRVGRWSEGVELVGGIFFLFVFNTFTRAAIQNEKKVSSRLALVREITDDRCNPWHRIVA